MASNSDTARRRRAAGRQRAPGVGAKQGRRDPAGDAAGIPTRQTQKTTTNTTPPDPPYPRVSDGREGRCPALLIEHLLGQASASVAAAVRSNWYALRDADDGCT